MTESRGTDGAANFVDRKQTDAATNNRLSTLVLLVCLACCASIAQASQTQSPEQVMTEFLEAFVDYDYATCLSLLAPGATITIVRSEDSVDYGRSHKTAAEWLGEVRNSGAKDLENFSVSILEASRLDHRHGTTVTLKFTASGNAGPFDFSNYGFDTGNLVRTNDGWRIVHYSSFESFVMAKRTRRQELENAEN
ncbi:MAG: nuclear transport factor 2 family protein [Woeseiaceae bacterium]|nr:nuclear transport factor 2 family protein [Woeseiaceae bacterium]